MPGDTSLPNSGSKSFFTMGCDVCGRRMRVPIHLLGGMVRCQHCNAAAHASVGTSSPGGSHAKVGHQPSTNYLNR